MGKFGILASVAAAELAGHWLGLGYGFLVMLAAFTFVALRMSATMATGSNALVKAQAAHQRLDLLVPKVGTIETTANGAQTTANNALPKSGGTVTGNLTVNGDHTIAGNLLGSGGTLTTGSNFHVSGGGATVDLGLTVHGNHSVDGNAAIGGTLSGASGGTVESTAIHAGGTILADGQVNAVGNMSAGNFGGPYQGGQGAVTPVPTTGFTLAETATAVNGVINRLDSSGLIS
jgi:hypothetical protein